MNGVQCTMFDLRYFLPPVKLESPLDEVSVLLDVGCHEVTPQPAHGSSAGEARLVQVYEDVDQHILQTPSQHETSDGVSLHL